MRVCIDSELVPPGLLTKPKPISHDGHMTEQAPIDPNNGALYNCTGDAVMGLIAIDTSVAMAVVLNEPARERLLQLTYGSKLIAAPTMPWEVGNALTALFKQGRITLSDALVVLENFEQIPVQLVAADIGESIKIASKWNLYAYDAYVITCADSMKAPLLSLDRRQCDAARQAGVQVLEVFE